MTTTSHDMPTDAAAEHAATAAEASDIASARDVCDAHAPLFVLTVGDGNFSFSLAYLKKLRLRYANHRQVHLVATSYDSFDELTRKYPESVRICAQLHALGARVLHRVDATNLAAALQDANAAETAKDRANGQDSLPPLPAAFDEIVFNHPHCGEENLQRHQSLLSHFYASARAILRADSGHIHLTLAEGQPQRWQARERAAAAGLHVVDEIDDVDAHPEHCVEYERKRHQDGRSFHRVLLHGERVQQPSTLFVFGREVPVTERQSRGAASTSIPQVASAPSSRKRKASDARATGEFVCVPCCKHFKTAQGLKTHVRMVHELGQGVAGTKIASLPCGACDRVFKNEDARRQHRVSKHGSDPTIQPDWYQLSAHSKAIVDAGGKATDQGSPRDQSKLVCKICSFAYVSQVEFDEHWTKLKPKTSISLQCPACPRVFKEERALRQHLNFCRVRLPTAQTLRSLTLTAQDASAVDHDPSAS